MSEVRWVGLFDGRINILTSGFSERGNASEMRRIGIWLERGLFSLQDYMGI